MASLSSLVVDLQVQSAQLKSGLDKANAQIKSFSDKTARQLDDANGKLGLFAKGFDRLGKMAAGAFALGKIINFAQSSAQAFIESERATSLLGNSLKQMGYEAKALLPALEEQASAFERSSLVSGEAVKQIQTLLVGYGTAPKDIERTTQAILDYSAATGKDAVSAAETLLKGVTQGKDGVRSLGLEYISTGDQAKDLNIAVDQLAAQWGGAASEAAAGFGGELHRMGVEYQDLTKAFGSFIGTLNEKLGVLRAIVNALKDYNYLLSDEREQDKGGQRRREKELLANERVVQLQESLKRAEAALAKEQADPGFLNETGAWRARVEKVQNELAGAKAYLAQARKEIADANAKFAATPQPGNIATTEASNRAQEVSRRTSKGPAKEKKLSEPDIFIGKIEDTSGDWDREYLEKLLHIAGNFDRSAAALGQDVSARQARMGMLGTSAGEQAIARGGFANFDAALQRYADAMGEHERKLAEARRFELDSKFVEMNASLLAADELKGLAENAGVAADEFTERAARAAEEAAQGLESLKSGALDMLTGILSSVAGKMGRLGSMAQGVAGGAFSLGSAGAMLGPVGIAGGAAAGGYLGFLSGLMDAATSGEGFQVAVGMLDNMFQALSDAVSQWLVDAQPLLGALGMLVDSVIPLITGGLRGLAESYVMAAPSIAVLAMMVDALVEEVSAIADSILGMAFPINSLDSAAQFWFDAAKKAALMMMRGALATIETWNNATTGIVNMLRGLAAVDLGEGWKPFAFLDNIANTLNAYVAPVGPLSDAITKLENVTLDGAQAATREAAARYKNVEATHAATAALLNVPSGFKVAMARWEATAAPMLSGGGPGSSRTSGGWEIRLASGGIVNRPTRALIGEGGEPEAVAPLTALRGMIQEAVGGGMTVNIHGVTDPNELWRRLKDLMRRDNFRAGVSIAGRAMAG